MVGSGEAVALLLNFDAERCHATLLGLMNNDRTVNLPAVLHLPNQGSLRITATGPAEPALGYDAHRGDPEDANFVKVTFPAATLAQPRVEYRCEVTAIYPSLGKHDKDPRLSGFQRNWLNILQLSPHYRVLANNSTSDACMMCMYEYADIARHTPPLADRLTVLDLIRQSLDRYLDGAMGVGLAGYIGVDDPAQPPMTNPPYLDTYPSLLISAAVYVQASGDNAWLERNYAGVTKWMDAMLAMDHDGSGLIEFARNGNYNTMHDPNAPAANWWDGINFGHKDAYSNALAYRALCQVGAAVETIGHREDAARYRAAAEKLRASYFKTFYNPATRILGGWRSADGELHDYWFPWVNGIAIHYGLVPKDQAKPIMDRLLAKMKEVGFNRFDLGLPGNLVPIPKKDYVAPKSWRFGGGDKEDGSEGFQHYENGSATACFAYFTLAALYDLGRGEEADRMLFPMMGGFDRNDFEGRDFLTRSKDWKSWDGAAFGYEGFLADNYYALLAVLARQGRLRAWTTH